ncbi:hypothetical protein BJ138DRAFT_1153397 [Hygrophoropsis aurantiaca]|uniref:Uncharacterized protein n=1 Tax=Hygrophoropsis aurantiaca TaxID=72124 RepID=A0ACB8A9S3_9AGAM|nr:hypothetical protein BJ138DRAFT_1153397 [Hygrophoropsis aurantiaca]
MSIPQNAPTSHVSLKKERKVSYDWTSQFVRGISGTSACGLAALNFVRIVFEQLGEQSHRGCAKSILRTITAKEKMEVSVSSC